MRAYSWKSVAITLRNRVFPGLFRIKRSRPCKMSFSWGTIRSLEHGMAVFSNTSDQSSKSLSWNVLSLSMLPHSWSSASSQRPKSWSLWKSCTTWSFNKDEYEFVSEYISLCTTAVWCLVSCAFLFCTMKSALRFGFLLIGSYFEKNYEMLVLYMGWNCKIAFTDRESTFGLSSCTFETTKNSAPKHTKNATAIIRAPDHTSSLPKKQQRTEVAWTRLQGFFIVMKVYMVYCSLFLISGPEWDQQKNRTCSPSHLIPTVLNLCSFQKVTTPPSFQERD